MASKLVQEGKRITVDRITGLFEGFYPGEVWSGIRSRVGIGPGIRSEEGRSGEAASCSYHIII